MTATLKSLLAAKAFAMSAKSNDDKRDAGLPTDLEGITRFNDIVYGPAKKPGNLLDISMPSDRTADKSDDPVPVIINIHGGGWIYGSKETYQFYCLHLATYGFAVVNFTYRLPPQVEFPGEMDDVNLVFHWVADHVGEYNLDASNVFVVGDSAGGQMADQYLTILTNPGYRAKFGYERPDLTVRAAAINCGASFITAKGMISNGIDAYFTADVVKEKKDLMETEKYMTKRLPPLFLMTSNQDFIRDCTVRLDGFLLAKGIRHEFHSYGDEKNPQGHVFHCDVRNKTALECNKEEMEFFRRHVG